MSRHTAHILPVNDKTRSILMEELGQAEARVAQAHEALQMAQDEVEVRTKRTAILRRALEEIEQLPVGSLR